jgi:hypothetical protein
MGDATVVGVNRPKSVARFIVEDEEMKEKVTGIIFFSNSANESRFFSSCFHEEYDRCLSLSLSLSRGGGGRTGERERVDFDAK